MSLFPRLRLALARRPWLYWLFVCICAAAVWLSVADAQQQVTAARDEWGATRRVWVADHDVAAGEQLHATAVEYPRAMLPASAVVSSPKDVLAARSISAGEVVVAADLAGGGPIPAGWAVFAVPVGGAPALVGGDAVLVFGSGRQWCEGIVATTTDEQIDLGVPADCAAPLSAQLALGAVALARAP
jgi:hypothetical protein